MKTLKDLYNEMPMAQIEGNHIKMEIYSLLRQSAIEWIKKMEKENEKDDGVFRMPDGDCYYNESYEAHEIGKVIHWIKYFFNIQESDLKELPKPDPKLRGYDELKGTKLGGLK